MTNTPIKVIIVDDHEIILDGLRDMLNLEPDIEIVGKASGPEMLFALLKNKTVDVVLMDVEMPKMDGIEATKIIKEQYPELNVLILTQHNRIGMISHAIKNGASGYVLKTAPKRTLIEGIRSVHNGLLFTQGIKLPSANQNTDEPSLTESEKKVISLIVQEKTAQEIATELKLSINTINQHTKNIRSKLGVKNVVGIVNYAYKNGLC